MITLNKTFRITEEDMATFFQNLTLKYFFAKKILLPYTTVLGCKERKMQNYLQLNLPFSFHILYSIYWAEQNIWIYSIAFVKAYTNVRYWKQSSVVFLFIFLITFAQIPAWANVIRFMIFRQKFSVIFQHSIHVEAICLEILKVQKIPNNLVQSRTFYNL